MRFWLDVAKVRYCVRRYFITDKTRPDGDESRVEKGERCEFCVLINKSHSWPLNLYPRSGTMARKSDATASLHNLTKDIAAIQDSARGCSTPKPSKEGAADLLESAQHILGMTGQDQTKFLDSIDQVCKSDRLPFFSETF